MFSLLQLKYIWGMGVLVLKFGLYIGLELIGFFIRKLTNDHKMNWQNYIIGSFYFRPKGQIWDNFSYKYNFKYIPPFSSFYSSHNQFSNLVNILRFKIWIINL